MTARKSTESPAGAKRRNPRKKRPVKKRLVKTYKAAKKRGDKKGRAKQNAAAIPKPIEEQITGELKYKLKAAQLELDAVSQRIEQRIAAAIKRIRDDARQADPAWCDAFEARRIAINELMDAEESKLPTGFVITRVDTIGGTYGAIYDPDNVGNRL